MTTESDKTKQGRRFGCGQVLVIVLITVLVTAGLTFWWVKHNLYASSLEPVKLSTGEKQDLEEKVRRLEEGVTGRSDGGLEPEKYDGALASREIELSERELNYLIGKDDPKLAEQVAIDLSEDLVSLKLVIPMDPDFPVLGGRTLRLKAGLTVDFDKTPPEISLRGVSLGGISLPNKWLGDLKNQNLIREVESGDGLSEFLAGVETMKVSEGKITVRLKE